MISLRLLQQNCLLLWVSPHPTHRNISRPSISLRQPATGNGYHKRQKLLRDTGMEKTSVKRLINFLWLRDILTRKICSLALGAPICGSSLHILWSLRILFFRKANPDALRRPFRADVLGQSMCPALIGSYVIQSSPQIFRCCPGVFDSHLIILWNCRWHIRAAIVTTHIEDAVIMR